MTDLFASRYIGSQLRITLSDQRVVIGKLVCCDNALNLALKNSEELVTGTKVYQIDNLILRILISESESVSWNDQCV